MTSEPIDTGRRIASNDLAPAFILHTITIPEIPGRTAGKRLPVNGIDLYFEIFGSGEPLLLCLRRRGDDRKLVRADSRAIGHVPVDRPGRPGHGRTNDGDGPIDFAVMASDFEALLDHLGIARAMIVGWSDGGVIGLEMAIRRPDLVGKVVALGTHARPEGLTGEFKSLLEALSPETFPAILSEGYKALSPDGPDHWPVVL